MERAITWTATRRATLALVLGSAMAAVASAPALAQGNHHGKRPFGTTFSSSSTTQEVVEASVTEDGNSSEPVELLRTFVKVRPQDGNDLVIRLDSDCGALINVPEVAEGEEAPATASGATVTTWVELDGEPVAIVDNGTGETPNPEDASVVLCRAGNDDAADFAAADPESLAAQLNDQQELGGFAWTASGLGRGTHELVVMGQLNVQADEGAGGLEPSDAMAVLGDRIVTAEVKKISSDSADEGESSDE